MLLAKTRLRISEESLVKYEKQHSIISTDDNQSIASQKLSDMNRALTDAERRRIEAESEYKNASKARGNTRALDNPVIQTLKQQRAALQTEYQQKLQIYKPAYPEMVQLKKQINEATKQIRIESNRISTGSTSDLKAKFLAAKQMEDTIRERLASQEDTLINLREKSIAYHTLQRDVKTNREIYEVLLQRLKEVGVAEGASTNNISVVDPAVVPFSKHKPNTKLNLALGLALGLFIGFVIAFILEFMDDRIRTVEELEQLLDIPVLGIVPFFRRKDKSQALLTVLDPQSLTAEAFRSMRTNLLFSTREGAPKIMHITSAKPNEGKTSAAVNLAGTFSQSGKTVLLIDADLRKPDIHRRLDLDGTVGLSNYLIGQTDDDAAIIQATSVSGLFAMPAGPVSPNPVELLSSERMLELLRITSEKYDYIIIDSPPVMGLADALVLSNRASATIFLAASNQSKRPQLLDALNRLTQAHGNVIGSILSKAKNVRGSYSNFEYYYYYQGDKKLTSGASAKKLTG